MALTKSDYRNGVKTVPVAQGAEDISIRVEITPAAAGAGDIFSMLPVPFDHQVVDVILDTDDLDSNGAPTITLSVGYLNSGETDLDVTDGVNGDGAAWIAASTIGQAGGVARPTTKSLWRAKPRVVSASNGQQLNNLGVKVVAGAATFQAGKVGLTVVYRAAHYGG